MKNNLRFWLKKMYLLQQISFSDELIREGLNKVEVWLCSTGGSGSNLLKNYVDDYVKVKSPYSAALLTHHKEPVDFNKPGFKAIYLHSDPFMVLKSVKRRNLVETNIKKLNNNRRLECTDEQLLASVFNQFKNWTQSNVDYPILCLKFEALYDSLDILSEYLGAPFGNFPPKRDRLSSDIVIDQQLYRQFEEEYKEWLAYPGVIEL